ncbi:hypothetical protein [Litorivivens sp.]|uniref:hypothetical protein n=1 Tax=Litorivivens sp. TaxID=2020868 RepID=UPI0035659A7C
MTTHATAQQRDILIIEESIAARVELKLRLSSLNCAVHIASSYEQAIHTLQERSLCLVLASESLSPADRAALRKRIERLATKNQPRLVSIRDTGLDFPFNDDYQDWIETEVGVEQDLATYEPRITAEEFSDLRSSMPPMYS